MYSWKPWGSHLHRLFRPHGTSSWIRWQHLEQARRDLSAPALRLMHVHQIAARWGFPDRAAFTRALTAYSVSTNENRGHALDSPRRPDSADRCRPGDVREPESKR
ncbi:hypothetical protein [Actinomadura sp. NPDC048394]|uniref:hypothetical protein n=1 Tax=Actinomadura sp. NPDC048394 TaxID=3158223 RepID=UPI0033FC0792